MDLFLQNMKFNRFTWKMYVERQETQDVIDSFAKSAEEVREMDIAFKYNKRLQRLFDNPLMRKEVQSICNGLWLYNINKATNTKRPTNLEEARIKYEDVICQAKEEGSNGYAGVLGDITWISFLLFYYAPEFFFPYLFQYDIRELYKIADTFEISMPTPPKKADYRARCMHYWALCEKMYQYRTEKGFTPAELCAFLYDFAPNYIDKETTDNPPPANAWFIGGKIDEEDLTNGFWQGNVDTKKGDILVHYEPTPISAITCLWRSATDGIIDPFFHYYGEIYLQDKMEVPFITLKELRADSYFSQHPLVRKNFQGVNGWKMSGRDYAELKRIWKSKGFDITVLPELYAPSLPEGLEIKLERDVEEKLLIPMLLSPIGLQEGRDYVRQQAVQAGRAHEKYTDFAIRFREEGDEPCADVVIEAKLHIKNARDFHDAFGQGASYARLLRAKVMCLCDKECFMIFEDENGFHRDKYKRVFWEELRDPDVFNVVKKILK